MGALTDPGGYYILTVGTEKVTRIELATQRWKMYIPEDNNRDLNVTQSKS